MKWGEVSERTVERINGWTINLLGARGIFVLALVTAFVLLSGADSKWR